MVAQLVCPICKNPVPVGLSVAESAAPFCSVRCRQIDLSRWFDGRYAIVTPLSPLQQSELAASSAEAAALVEEGDPVGEDE